MALAAYEKLFPRDGGWFVQPPNQCARIMMLAPVPFMGIGANYRRKLYSKEKTFESLEVDGQYTRANLVKWNNVAVALLTKPF